ncbi:MAG: hypothetical protein ACREMB_20690 [Candidatus Rokuibacteriota bacterium]
MNEIKALLKRQARWQKSRRALSWPEKIRMAERVRDSAERWCSKAGKPPVGDDKSKSARA